VPARKIEVIIGHPHGRQGIYCIAGGELSQHVFHLQRGSRGKVVSRSNFASVQASFRARKLQPLDVQRVLREFGQRRTIRRRASGWATWLVSGKLSAWKRRNSQSRKNLRNAPRWRREPRSGSHRKDFDLRSKTPARRGERATSVLKCGVRAAFAPQGLPLSSSATYGTRTPKR